jgi:hypothetical protein
MATYVFRMSYSIHAQSRPIIVEAECLEDAEEQAYASAIEAGTAAIIDVSTFSTLGRGLEGVHAC